MDLDRNAKGEVIAHPLEDWLVASDPTATILLQLRYRGAQRLQLSLSAQQCRDLAHTLIEAARRRDLAGESRG